MRVQFPRSFYPRILIHQQGDIELAHSSDIEAVVVLERSGEVGQAHGLVALSG